MGGSPIAGYGPRCATQFSTLFTTPISWGQSSCGSPTATGQLVKGCWPSIPQAIGSAWVPSAEGVSCQHLWLCPTPPAPRDTLWQGPAPDPHRPLAGRALACLLPPLVGPSLSWVRRNTFLVPTVMVRRGPWRNYYHDPSCSENNPLAPQRGKSQHLHLNGKQLAGGHRVGGWDPHPQPQGLPRGPASCFLLPWPRRAPIQAQEPRAGGGWNGVGGVGRHPSSTATPGWPRRSRLWRMSTSPGPWGGGFHC